MATLTSNPVAGTVTPCDGEVDIGGATSWTNARSGTTGSLTASAITTTDVVQGEKFGSAYNIRRCVFNFDTSSLTSAAVITSATFSVYTTASGDNSETTNPANGALVGATPTGTANVLTTDFGNFGTTRYANTDILVSNAYNTTGYKDWVMNATGIAAINKTGITSLGLRPSNDFSNATAPTARSYWFFDMADAGVNPPKLVVTYTIGGNSAMLAFF